MYKKEKLKYIYEEFITNTQEFHESYFIDNNIDDFDEIYDKMDIWEDMEYIERKNKKYGYIIVRKYKGENKLVIGCGNNPYFCCGGYIIDDEKHLHHYQYFHSHDNCYTIDPLFGKNASTMGYFGHQNFLHIPNRSFDIIHIEGINVENGPTFYNELKRLAKTGALLVFDEETFIEIDRNDTEIHNFIQQYYKQSIIKTKRENQLLKLYNKLDYYEQQLKLYKQQANENEKEKFNNE